MKTPGWLKMRKRSEPELPEEPPIWLNNRSNGEYFHFQTEHERKLKRFILQTADENARKIGINRRDFLASAMGMATSLWCINYASGCSSNEVGHNASGTGKNDSGSGAGGPDASSGGLDASSKRPAVCDTYTIQPEMMYDEQAACGLLHGDEFIFDIQTHFFETDGEWITTNPGYVNIITRLVGTADFGMNHYIDVLFCQSDTKMAVLSCWPGVLCSDAQAPPCGLPMSTDGAAAARDTINKMANSQRLLSHAMILPNDPSGIDAQLRIMEKIRCESGVAAWKLYPAAGLPHKDGGGGGFFMTDPDVGLPTIEKGIELGVPLFCIHKGLPIPGFNFDHNQPWDIGIVAAKYPQAKFICYHSAINASSTEGMPSRHEAEYIEGDRNGVNALITAMRDNGVGPNENVFAELGSSWNQVMYDSTAAAHYLGKLMKYVGEDNVCWGTDSMVGGTPQPQIQALRAASIPQAMQDQYGYPELTPERKAKIFGLNSARIYGVDVNARRCQIDQCEVGMLKKNLDDELGKYRWAYDAPLGPKTFEEYQRQGRETIKRGFPG